MSETREVVVVDVKIPFWSMVVLLVKWAIAAIPAMVILCLVLATVVVDGTRRRVPLELAGSGHGVAALEREWRTAAMPVIV